MADGARHLLVGRLRKPHGLKGEVSCFPLTDRPEAVFVEGATLAVLDLAGAEAAPAVTIERARGYHREWLLKFTGADDRDAVERFRDVFLAVREDALPPLADDEVFIGDLEGFAVVGQDGAPLGLVTALYELPQGLTLEVQGPKREFLLPFSREFVVALDRGARRMVVAPPDGLLDL